MIRKLQNNGKKLTFVFIPKAFTELLELNKGQKVDVRVHDGKIIIVPIAPSAKIVGLQAASTTKGVPA